jgi:hypothetical protein
MDVRHPDVLREIRSSKVMTDALAAKLQAAIQEYKELEQ